jgi:hypothetical protein
MLDFFNGKLKVFDNVLDQRELKAWEHFYINELTFRRSSHEDESAENIYFCRDLGYKENIEIFDYERTIVPNAQKVNLDVRSKFQRSYINCFNRTDKFVGHADCEPVPNDRHFVSTILFLSPEWNTPDGGIEFRMGTKTVLIKNVYNRLICFSGDIWHCIQPFDAHRARLTHYCTFSNMIKPSRLTDQNKW